MITTAANLLHQSLGLQHGGVVYLDTSMNYRGRENNPQKDPKKSDPKAQDYFGTAIGPLSVPRRRNSGISTPGIFMYNRDNSLLDERKPQNPAGIINLLKSTNCMSAEANEIASFTPLSKDTLQYFLNRYPQGKQWSFDKNGSLSASEEVTTQGESTTLGNRATRSQKMHLIAGMLWKHFSAVEQLIRLCQKPGFS